MNAQIRTLFSCLFVCAAARAADFYVDAERGRDAQPGTSPEQAWQTLERVNAARLNPGDRVRFKCGQMWRGSLSVQPGAQDAPVTYTSYPGTGERAGWKPRILRSVDLAAPALWQPSGSNIWKAVPSLAGGTNVNTDIGNIVLVQKGATQKTAAFKRWSIDELRVQGDFFSSPLSPAAGPRTIFFYSEKNPAELYGLIEAAPKINAVSVKKPEWYVLDGLAFGNTAAHGIGGAGHSHVRIRNCDFFWIGGGHLDTRNNTPTRYGNGVEFWCAATDCVVEGCRFWQIYDTAMTNQGNEKCRVADILWRNNTVYLCEQAYEIWFSDPESEVNGVTYEGNSSYDCGFGWGHAQRPNKNGTHLLAYRLASKALKLHVRNNRFCNSADRMIWFFNPRLNEADCNRNVFWQEGADPETQPLFAWSGAHAKGTGFGTYRTATGNDSESRFENIERVPFFDY